MSRSFVTFLADAGLILTLLTLTAFSIINIAVIAERIIFFRRNGQGNDDGFLEKIRGHILAGKASEAALLCAQGATSLHNIVIRALEVFSAREGK